MASALFDISDDGEDQGYQAANSEVVRFELRNAAGVGSVFFQVYDPAGPNPTLGVAANPPRASSGAPTLTLVGSTSGQAAAPVTVDGTVTSAMPASGGHSWIVRCVVNRGQRTLPSGKVVLDPSLIHERGLWVPTGYSTRKIVATETTQFGTEGWAEAVNELIETGVSPGTYSPQGLLAVVPQSIAKRFEGEIFVTDFMSDAAKAGGRDGTLVFDMQPAVQAAIDFSLYRNIEGGGSYAGGPKVTLPPYLMKLDRTLHVGYGLDFRSIEVEGHGTRYGGTFGQGGAGTAFYVNFANAPGIAVQGGRNVKLKGFAIYGQNDAPYYRVYPSPNAASRDIANWWDDADVPASAHSRYAPYAAIAIDPYCGPRPVTSYPDVDYPAWLGAMTQYQKAASSNTKIEDVLIHAFVAGVAQQCCDFDGNGDYTKLDRVQMIFCAYGFVWGNSQSRVVSLKDCTIVATHTAFDNRTFGQGNGNPEIACYSCEFSQTIQWMDLKVDYGNGPAFYSCFCEADYQLGRVTGAASAGSVKFVKCTFGFSFWEQLGAPTRLMDNSATNVCSFEGCMMYITSSGFPAFYSTGALLGDDALLEPGRHFRFQDLFVYAEENVGEPYLQCAFNATQGMLIAYGATLLQEPYSCRSASFTHLDTEASLGPQVVSSPAQGPRTRCLPVYVNRAKALKQGNDPGIPVAWRQQSFNAAGAVVASGREVTFTLTGATAASLAHTGGDVGDALYCAATGAYFFVKRRTGTSITAEAQAGFDGDGNLLAAVPSAALFYALNCRRYTPIEVLYGNITSGSPIITGIVKGDGSAPDLTAHFAVGDCIYVDEDVDRIIAPASAAIGSMDNTAKEITFGGNFLFTRTRMRLGIFVRTAMPNTA